MATKKTATKKNAEKTKKTPKTTAISKKSTQKPLTKKTYVESHWLIFATQGVIALVFGIYALFTDITNIPYLMVLTSLAIGAIGIIEVFNALLRRRHHEGWVATLLIAFLELGVALALFLTRDTLYVTHISIVAGYAIVRGAFGIYLGIRALKDITDRIIWTISGIFGAILGFVILADPGRSQTTFFKMFGIYLAILGLTNLVYSVHSRNSQK